MALKDTINGLQHTGIPVRSIEEAAEFYKKLGFESRWTMTRDNGQTVLFMENKGFLLELYDKEEAPGVSGAINHIALDVSDIEKAYEEVRTLGCRVIDGGVIHDLPYWEKGVRYFVIEGPNKERVEFCQKL